MRQIIFIHGMFQNAKSWAHWKLFFSDKGFDCKVLSWPLHEGDPVYLRNNPPEGLGDLSLDDVVTEIEAEVVKAERPIVIGHSVGGLIVQLLADRDLISLGVAISPVAPNRMLDFDWDFFKNSALITNPFKGNQPFFMDEAAFHQSFANTLSEEEAQRAWHDYATHDSRNILRDCMSSSGQVDLEQPHVPLLFIGAEADKIIPASLVKKNAEAYQDEHSITAFREFPKRSHFICGEPGWEEVATHVHEWMVKHMNPS